MSYQKKASDFDRYTKDQGADYVLFAGQAGRAMLGFSVTSGGAPDTVSLAALGLPNMADTSYQVLVNGETAAAVSVDESSKTVGGFNILGGGAAEVLHVLIFGRLANMPAA